MAHHYILRRNIELWNSSRTYLAFWIRRFFRIAPLYYILLAIALLLGPWLSEYRTAIAYVWPNIATLLERYNDQTIKNIIAHLSFIFWLLPDFAFHTPLPDWYIGLEMQFYLAFPFIMLAISHIGSIKAGVIIVTVCLLSQMMFSNYFHQFQMPAFLPIKLYVFLIGIWIATAREQKSMLPGLVFSLLLGGLWIYFEKTTISVARVFLVLLMFYLMNNGSLPGSLILQGSIDKIRKGLSCWLARFLGDTSYAVYLLHLIILLPVAGELAQFSQYLDLKASYRFGVCLLVSAPIIYLISWLLHESVEKKGDSSWKVCFASY